MKKKILCAVLAVVIFVTGCGQSGKSNNNLTANKVSLPVAVPDGGWTFKEAAETIYIKDHQISYPFKVESLGSDFSVKEETTKFDSDGCVTTLFYKNEPVCSLSYDYVFSFDGLEKKEATVLYITEMDDFGNRFDPKNITFNGFYLNQSCDDAYEIFGEPGEKTIYSIGYFDRQTKNICFAFAYDQNDKIFHIAVMFRVTKT